MESRNKSTMCRLCLCENESFIDIFGLNDQQGCVPAEVISDLFQFQVSETDFYPHVVCSTCLTKLTDFKLFKECCQKSKVIYDDMFALSEALVKHHSEEEASVGVNGLLLCKEDPIKDTSSREPDGSGVEFYEEVPIKASSSQESGHSGIDLEMGEQDSLGIPSSDEAVHDGSDLELGEQDSLGDSSSDPIVKQEELDISGDESAELLDGTNTESVFGPILLKNEMLKVYSDCQKQEEVIESEEIVNVDPVEPPATIIEDTTQEADHSVIGSQLCEEGALREESSDEEDLEVNFSSGDETGEPFKGFDSEESIESEESGNMGQVEPSPAIMEGFSQEEQENVIAPENGVRIIKGRFECDHCKKVFTTKSHLIKHMKTHGFGNLYVFEDEEGGKGTVAEKRIRRRKCKFECHCCRKLLMTKCSLKQHLVIHRIGKYFKCDVCGKICVSKCHLTRHKRLHTGVRPYKCTDCSALFRNNSNLKVHMRVHTKIKPFKCKECNLSFSQNSNLKSHMTIHSNLKPYSCEVCHVAFRQKYNLTSHMRTHSGDRPYKCTACSKAFSQSAHLRRHQVVHTGEKPHPCPHCNKRHIKTVCV